MRLVLLVKDHQLYNQRFLIDLPKEHRSFRHYPVVYSILQSLPLMNVGS